MLSRIALFIALLAGSGLTVSAAELPAGHRIFPAHALRGELLIASTADVVINGRAGRLAPGARIRGENNELLLSGALLDQRFVVHYTLERGSGLMMDVWVLRAVERANRIWPTTEAEAQAWTFEPASQTWTKP